MLYPHMPELRRNHAQPVAPVHSFSAPTLLLAKLTVNRLLNITGASNTNFLTVIFGPLWLPPS
jgi:hypothetical protein